MDVMDKDGAVQWLGLVFLFVFLRIGLAWRSARYAIPGDG
jgi:hypothetical protein